MKCFAITNGLFGVFCLRWRITQQSLSFMCRSVVISRLDKLTSKETCNSYKKWPWNLCKIGNIAKAATFESFLHLIYKNTHNYFFVIVLFNIFMRQILTNGFWGLHKNTNCAFPLRSRKEILFTRPVGEFKINVLSFSFWWVQIKKISIYCSHSKGWNSWVGKNPFSTSTIKMYT